MFKPFILKVFVSLSLISGTVAHADQLFLSKNPADQVEKEGQYSYSEIYVQTGDEIINLTGEGAYFYFDVGPIPKDRSVISLVWGKNANQVQQVNLGKIHPEKAVEKTFVTRNSTYTKTLHPIELFDGLFLTVQASPRVVRDGFIDMMGMKIPTKEEFRTVTVTVTREGAAAKLSLQADNENVTPKRFDRVFLSSVKFE